MSDNVMHPFPDETPTRPVERVSTRTLAILQRIDRLAELAQAVATAATELASIRHLCTEGRQ